MFSSRSASRFRGPLERLGKVIVVEDVVQLKNELINAASDAERIDALENRVVICYLLSAMSVVFIRTAPNRT